MIKLTSQNKTLGKNGEVTPGKLSFFTETGRAHFTHVVSSPKNWGVACNWCALFGGTCWLLGVSTGAERNPLLFPGETGFSTPVPTIARVGPVKMEFPFDFPSNLQPTKWFGST